MRATIKVLIVDDSALIRQMLTRALSVDPRIEIVGVAKTGVEAIEKARDLDPDVITLDIEMPELTGLEALPHISKNSSARVLVLSTLDDPDTTYQALAGGAIDFINKPKAGFASSISDLSELLLKKIRTAYRIDPVHAARARDAIHAPADEPAEEGDAHEPPHAMASWSGPEKPASIIAVAASTGGPPALERVFQGLSASLPAAYVVVQHLPAGFSTSLARRLDSVGDINVVEAQDGMSLERGKAFLAPHGQHMTVCRGPAGPEIRLAPGQSIHGVKPAADPLFDSVASMFKDRSVGVVLTGMGSDGVDGLRTIKAAGGETIAQNEETSVVWGMPGAAMRVGAVRHVVPIGLVAAEIRRSMRRAV